ncbi:MAG: hypothetical protein VYA55_22170 [Pseudomonadota bacterium]|nr:hypothetical protein [Pseudomonadota bacterium]
MERRKFFALGLAGMVGSSLVARVASAAQSALSTKLAGSVYYTKESPGRWSAKVAGHAPVVDVKGGQVTVTTPHEMNGYEHYIVKHTVFDKDMNILGETMFDPTQAKGPISSHDLKGYKGTAYALSMCNKHDCWLTEFSV